MNIPLEPKKNKMAQKINVFVKKNIAGIFFK